MIRHSEIESDRLTLRMLQTEDAEWIAREISNPNVHRWLTTPPKPYTVQDGQDFVAKFKDDPRHRAILYQGQPVGEIGMSTTRGPSYEFGYWLRESAWGQGIMSEAAEAMLDWHWSQSKAPLLSGWIKGNQGSAQILTQLGFTYTGERAKRVKFYDEDRTLYRVRQERRYQPFPSIRTERLILNATTLEDLSVIQSQLGDPRVARMTASVTPNWNNDQARNWVTSRQIGSKRGFGRAIRLHDGTFIGTVGMGGDPRNLGYMLVPDQWGKGYATEAVRAFLKMAYARYADFDQIEAGVYDDNPGSANVLTKLGFVRQGASDCHSLGRVEKSASSLYRVTRATAKV